MLPEPGRPSICSIRFCAIPILPKGVAEKWHAFQPGFDELEERRSFLRFNNRLVVGLIEAADLGMLVVIGAKATLHSQAQGGFDLAELSALKAGRAFEAGTKVEEIERRHRFQDI